jgi:hypothetical protein
MTKKLQFSLSVQVNKTDSDVSYTVSPGSRTWTADGLEWHEWEYDPTKVLTIVVSMTKPPDTQSHVIISNLKANGIAIDQFDQTGTYVRHDTKEVVKNTYGYMSWPGTYTFKIRYAPQIHNYITYLAKLAYE